jgi:23S rRNA (cytosine1962-C5)-methyltransferase
MENMPTLRLSPKADARALRHGHPWVHGDQIVWDRRSRSIAPGSIALLEDAGRTPVALVAVVPQAKIAARILTRDLDASIDDAWLKARVQTAYDLRNRLYPDPYYRMIHAEGDDLPGLIVDRFGDTLVVQPNAIWIEDRLDALTAALIEVTGVTNVIKNAAGRARKLEELDDVSAVLAGSPPEKVSVLMNGATYVADLAEGQKTGLFFDQRPNHTFMASLAKDAKVLDMFAHVGGFALAALVAGGESALAIDGSAPALALAEESAALSGVADRFETRKSDAFAAFEALAEDGAKFDLVICDPPAFAPNKGALTAGLRAYERTARLATNLVAPGGVLMLCSCSHAATLDKFRSACLRGMGRAGRDPKLIYTGSAGPDHPVHPSLSDTGYLKALAFHLP